MPPDLSFESLFRLLFGFVQPCCTIETFPVLSRHFRQLPRFAPTHLAKLLLWNARQVLVDGHEVIGLPQRVQETLCEEFIKRLQSL